ncbi:MAG TPA: hypothetical protein VFE76_15350 [Myxococcales bacterium]|nr:hypothetical protein [Myxococcales bacterium]
MLPYGQSLTLLTDLYQLTMAAAAWKSGVDKREGMFHLLFRRSPFQGGFTVAAGLATALDYLRAWRFAEDDLAYLASVRTAAGELMFEPAFIEHLRALEPRLDIDAVPEGTVVFPQEPLLRVSGPVVPCMLLAILASNELDEHLIESLKQQGARVTVWGVGTRLVTGGDEPALGGVYKLSAVRDAGGPWKPRIKLSEQSAKISLPGVLQIRRFFAEGQMAGDLIYDVQDGASSQTIVDPLDITRRKTLPPATPFEDLLVPVWRNGKQVYDSPALADLRARAQAQLGMLHPGIKRFVNPHTYPAGLDPVLHERRTKMILQARAA